MTENRQRAANLPIWKGIPDVTPLHGGLSNESFKVTDGGEVYVVRFGVDFPFHHVSREREIMATRAAHAAGFAPELVWAEPGTMVSRFIDGKTYDAADVRANINRIAETVRRYHTDMQAHVSGPAFMCWVFHIIRDYARTLKEGNSRMVANLPDYLELSAELEAAQLPLPIVFGHQDLLPANFIDDGQKLWLIDFEYAGFGTAMFDLAGTASNAEFDDDQAQDLLTAYFGSKPDEPLRKAHSAMQCASLLREAMWSMVSEIHLDVPGVDYVAYTQENLDRLDGAIERYRTRFGKG